MAKVLVPTDFSSNSLNAARYAVQLYGTEGVEFIVLNSFMMPRGAASTMWSIDDLLAKEAQEGVDGFMARMREEPELAKAELTGVVEHGDLPNVVDRFANDPEPPELVVMGTQGATGLKEVLMGSNTADVIKRGGLPVLAVPQNTVYKSPKRIILADDGGGVRKESIKVLVDIARWSHSEVMIVRVTDPERAGEEVGDSPYDTLLGAVPHSHHFISGENVNTALHDLADQSEADMVVLLHRKRGLFEQLFHRSTSTKLAMHTHIPMLVLQESDH